jgi:hypothetical protein
LGETPMHDDVNVKDTLNRILWKIVSFPTTYVLVFKTSYILSKVQVFFLTPPPQSEGPQLVATWVVGFDWS